MPSRPTARRSSCAKKGRPMSSPGSDYRDRVAEALRAAAEYSIVGEWICCDPINPDHELCVKGDIARQMLRAVLADDEEVLFVPSKVVDVVLAVPNPELERLREENAKLLYAADPARVEAAARLVDGLTRAARTQRDDARA